MRGILTGRDVDQAAEKGRYRNEEDIARAKKMRAWRGAGGELAAIALRTACGMSGCTATAGEPARGDLEQTGGGLHAAARGVLDEFVAPGCERTIAGRNQG